MQKKNSLPVTEAHTKERKASWGHITWSNSDDIWTDIQHVQKYYLRYMYVLSGYSLTNASVSYLTNAGIGEIKVHGQVVLQILRVMLRHVELFWLLRFLEISSQWWATFRFDFLYGNLFIVKISWSSHRELRWGVVINFKIKFSYMYSFPRQLIWLSASWPLAD